MNTGKSKSKAFCCGHGCNSSARKNSNLSFHKFPMKWTNPLGEVELIDSRKAWMKGFKMGKEPSKYTVVCSKHFKPENYYLPDHPTKRKTLKRDSVPSMNLPELPKRGTIVKSPSKVAAARRRERILKKHKHQEETQSAQTIDREVAEILLHLHEARPLEPIERRLEIPLHIEIPETSSTDHQSAMSSVSTQVTSGDFVAPFLSYINTEQVLNTLCGIPTFDILNFLCDEVSAIVVDKRLHKLTIKERVVLTLMKLKQNFSLRVLEILFKIYCFLRSEKQFSKEEALLNKEIARARVHIERSNQRIKLFKFFNGRYEFSYLNVVNEAFTVVCGLVNLCSPILANDKF